VQATGAALSAMAGVAEGLTVDPQRMRANLDSTNGAVFAERVMMLLAPTLGRDRVHRLVIDALEDSRRTGRSFTAALATLPEAKGVLTAAQLDSLGRPEDYLGSAEVFRRRLLGGS